MDSQIIIYQTEDGKTKLDVRLENETVWLSQKMMAELFDVFFVGEAEEGILEIIERVKGQGLRVKGARGQG